MTFETICELCRMARDLARQLGRHIAAIFLRSHSVPMEYAMASLVRKPL